MAGVWGLSGETWREPEALGGAQSGSVCDQERLAMLPVHSGTAATSNSGFGTTPWALAALPPTRLVARMAAANRARRSRNSDGHRLPRAPADTAGNWGTLSGDRGVVSFGPVWMDQRAVFSQGSNEMESLHRSEGTHGGIRRARGVPKWLARDVSPTDAGSTLPGVGGGAVPRCFPDGLLAGCARCRLRLPNPVRA